MAYRIDIQALRGLAVLFVVIYHANLLNLPGGYLGVDMFFVISGFLITSQISIQLLNNTFSFKAFYLRRAWRLLPALYAVLITCSAAAQLLLSNAELTDFNKQLIGTVTFSANIILWLQTGYFETAAELKPLLHMWSLSIEEQYYLILPAVLFIVKSKRWTLTAIILTLSSLLLMMLMNNKAPGATFYLTPTRVWQLGIGSVLALYLHKSKSTSSDFYGYIALIVVLVLTVKPISSTQYTFTNNLFITTATALLIAYRSSLLNSNFAEKIIAPIGTISYSLYLVHWPVIAFLNSASIKVSGPSIWMRVIAVLLSFILAIALYFLVEKKWRISNHTQEERSRPTLILLIIPIVLVSFTYLSETYRESLDAFPKRSKNVGLNYNCNDKSSLLTSLCKTSNTPEIIVWGDSYAMHLIPAMLTSEQPEFQQATRSTCSPFLKTAHFDSKKYNINAGSDCLKFNNAVFNYIIQNDSIKTVVLASSWHYLLHDKVFLTKVDNRYELQHKEKNTITEELINLVSTLKSIGKKVVIIAPPPASGFNSRKCHERDALGLLKLGGQPDCTLVFDNVMTHQAKVIRLVDKLKQQDIAVYEFINKLCQQGSCRTTLDDAILYNDGGHLSVDGSATYGQKFNLYQEILSLSN